MKQFSSFKGVALLTVLMLILIISLLATQLTKLFFDDIRLEKNIEFNSISNIFQQTLEVYFRNEFAQTLTENNASINKSTLSSINQTTFEFEEFSASLTVKDLSNCFNINALFSQQEDSLIVNPRAITLFKLLLAALEVDPAEIETITDQLLDWVDTDNLPRAYGLENYYYTGPLSSLKRFSSKRLFFHASELRQLPALQAVYENIKDSVCVLPHTTKLLLNINTLEAENAIFFSAFFMRPDLEEAEAIIASIPQDGYQNLQEFISTENLSLNTEVSNFLSTKSHAISIHSRLDAGFTLALYTTLMRIDEASVPLLDSYKD